MSEDKIKDGLDDSLDAIWGETIDHAGPLPHEDAASHTFQPLARGTDRHPVPSGLNLPSLTIDEGATGGPSTTIHSVLVTVSSPQVPVTVSVTS